MTAGIWAMARSRAARALAVGALEPLACRVERIDDGGYPFEVRVLAARARRLGGAGPANPFLDPEPALRVAETETHRVILNKFPVFAEHLLIVTRAFEEQRALLTVADFAALLAVMAEGPALGFYNAGLEAGASQRHKHLQVIPLAGDPPLATIFGGALPYAGAQVRAPGGPEAAHRAYQGLLAQAGCVSSPYNLLLWRSHLLVVPRRSDPVRGISLNALAWAGWLLASDDEACARIRRIGPLALLREGAVTPAPAPPASPPGA